MNLLLDTNILIYLSKSSEHLLLNSISDPEDKTFISVTALAELKSIALQNNWGQKKWKAIEKIINRSALLEINENLLEIYAQIDAYSQRKNSSFQEYPFATPRNMGKNDLWIAATAALLNLTLVTTDKDFDHLHKVFLEVKRITPKTLLN